MANDAIILSSVDSEYFNETPENITKGSSNVKAIFKGQYQVYPPIKTLTSISVYYSNILTYVIIQVLYEGNSWYYVVTNSTYVPAFRIYIHGTYTSYSSYDSYTYTADGYIDISAGSRTIGGKYSFTPTITSGSASILYRDFSYGIGSSYTQTSYDTGTYRVCAYKNNPETHLRGNTVYKFYLGEVADYNYPKTYCAANSFTITYQTGESSWNSINVPSSNNGTNAFGYLYQNYIWLYDSRMPRVPNNINNNSVNPKLNIFNVSENPTPTNSWHYPKAYFTNRTFSTLTNYYKRLTDDTSNINLFDYGVKGSQITTYRYDIPASSSNYLWQISKSSQYEWDFSSSATYTINRDNFQNHSNGFYILGIYFCDGSPFYLNTKLTQNGSTKHNETYNCYSYADYCGVGWTATFNLKAKKVTLTGGGGTYVNSNVSITYSANNPHNYAGSGNLSITVSLNPTSPIYNAEHKIEMLHGIDISGAWGHYKTITNNYTSINNYAKPTSLTSTKTFTVFCIIWSGFVGTARHYMGCVRLGNFTLRAKASTEAGVITL